MNYGTDPGRVITLLADVARRHPKVLSTPPPACFLTGYGDNGINYELRAWTDEYSDWFQIRSDLAVTLYAALKEAGMSFPFPQREVRLLNNDADPAATG